MSGWYGNGRFYLLDACCGRHEVPLTVGLIGEYLGVRDDEADRTHLYQHECSAQLRWQPRSARNAPPTPSTPHHGFRNRPDGVLVL